MDSLVRMEQLAMFGPAVPAMDLAGLSPHQKAELLLDQHPETRGDDRLLMLLWWERFDGLHELFRWLMRDLFEGEKADEELDAVAAAISERFDEWFRTTATHPETIRRRRAEIQSNRSADGALRGPASVTAYRRERDGAGPPRR